MELAFLIAQYLADDREERLARESGVDSSRFVGADVPDPIFGSAAAGGAGTASVAGAGGLAGSLSRMRGSFGERLSAAGGGTSSSTSGGAAASAAAAAADAGSGGAARA